MKTNKRKIPVSLWFIAILTMLGLAVTGAGQASANDDGHDKPSVCHPVNGNGETGNGWNIISPDKASSHIDEATGAGKHTSHDGRTDVYATDGQCPSTPEPEMVTICYNGETKQVPADKLDHWLGKGATEGECPPPPPPCEYNPDLSADDPNCVPPPPPCEWNPQLPSTDPGCVPPLVYDYTFVPACAVDGWSLTANADLFFYINGVEYFLPAGATGTGSQMPGVTEIVINGTTLSTVLPADDPSCTPPPEQLEAETSTNASAECTGDITVTVTWSANYPVNAVRVSIGGDFITIAENQSSSGSASYTFHEAGNGMTFNVIGSVNFDVLGEGIEELSFDEVTVPAECEQPPVESIENDPDCVGVTFTNPNEFSVTAILNGTPYSLGAGQTSERVAYVDGKVTFVIEDGDVVLESGEVAKPDTCEPPAQCPDGSNPGDANGDGEVNEEDCDYTPPTTPPTEPTVPPTEPTVPPTEPTVPPTEPTEPTTPPTGPTTPPTQPPAQPTTPPVPNGDLPKTGESTDNLVGVAIAAIIAGAAFLFITRRRTSSIGNG